MKSTFKSFQIVLLLCGVIGVDEDKVKSVSVMEGDSVTLNPDLTQIQGFNLIEWRFGDPVIAQIDGNDISYPKPTEMFRNRLQLDQTGSLTIKNMKTKHSGLYELQIRHSDGTLDEKFSVTVYESTSDAVKGEMKIESVKEGDPVTLQTDVTELHGDELIVWRSGDEGKLIAKADIEAKSSTLYDTDERFRDRLKLDHQTGSLIITNTRTTDSGLYTMKISSSKQTLYKRFTVAVSEPGLSSGAKAGIGVGVGIGVVVVLLVAAAAVVGVIYHRRKISELRKQTLPVTVTEGEDVILKPNNEIKKGDEIQWQYGDKKLRTRIAEIRGEPRETFTYDYNADERFRDRLDLDKTTGSLTIKNIRTAHSGLYNLHIISSRRALQQRFIVTVNEKVEEKSVEYGDSVTLDSDTEIQRNDQILWMFGHQDNLIAQIKEGTGETYDGDDERFRDRLKLDEKTGSLTITNIKAGHTGLYKLQIIISSRGGISYKKFRVFRQYGLTGEKSVHLNTDLPKIQTNDEIQWMFGDENSLIAEIKGGKVKTHDGPDGRFRNRLELNNQTGDLTIKNSTAEHEGHYNLKICSRGGILCKKFRVRKRYEYVVTGEKSVHLNTDLDEIQTNDEIQWMFGDENSLIAEIKGGNVKTYDGPDGRFRDRLELNNQTGDLTIKNSTARHERYKLKIRSSKGNTNRTYGVIIGDSTGKRVNEITIVEILLNESVPDGVNESAAVAMPLLNESVPDGVNESAAVAMPLLNESVPDGVNESAAVAMPLLNESVPDGVNESAAVAMPLLNESVPDGVNEQERTSSL